jgi:hypothetical protein
MTTYRDSETAGLVCERCHSVTVPPEDVSSGRMQHDGPFVCATCLLDGRDKTLRENAVLRALEPPQFEYDEEAAAERARRNQPDIPGAPALVLVVLVGLWAFFYFDGWRMFQHKAPDTALPAFQAPAAAPAPSASGELLPVRDHRSPELIERLGNVDQARRAEVFNRYAEPLAGKTERAMPTFLPAKWHFVGRPSASPFSAGVWDTAEPLTAQTVVVERDRLRLGGEGVRAGKPVTCAGAVELVVVPDEKVQGKKEPAVFVAACRGADGDVSFRLLRVFLPELANLLIGRLIEDAPRRAIVHPTVVSDLTHGVFSAGEDDCASKKHPLIATSSTLFEDKKDGLALVGLSTGRSTRGWELNGLDIRADHLCNGRLSGFVAGSRLELTCAEPVLRTICAR